MIHIQSSVLLIAAADGRQGNQKINNNRERKPTASKSQREQKMNIMNFGYHNQMVSVIVNKFHVNVTVVDLYIRSLLSCRVHLPAVPAVSGPRRL